MANKVKNMFLVLLPSHFCEVVMVTYLFTACCYSYTVKIMLWIMYKTLSSFTLNKEILLSRSEQNLVWILTQFKL